MENSMKIALLAAALLLVPTAIPALAQSGHTHTHAAPAAGKAAADDMAAGEVKRVNKDAKRITVAHGPLKAFDMPAMTMAFAVKDPALLAKVKEGDRIRFSLEKAGEDLVITRIEPAR
jgi:Cu/Ag efflux protein CusF